LPPPFDDAALARAVTAAAQANAFMESADKALESALAATERRSALSQRLVACGEQIGDMDRHIAHVEQEVARWSVFAKCMGNDGIIALAIDDAGPELSCRANELLMACYGPRFTVSIKTQLENAKGDLREGFEVTVHDALRNTSKNVGKMSGGERIWINECLTRAMALYLAEASSRRSSTLFSDEADGAFDAQHKRQFMAMKREVLRIGGYRQEYFISHTPELSEMADAVIDLDQFAGDAAFAATQSAH
jgi:exonuclease SbcC